MFKIMVVEDDRKIRGIILDKLKKWGYEGLQTDNFQDVFTDFIKEKPHLVLMDINLPYFDGYHWCTRIREISRVPIIFITSRDSNMDLIMAMNLGGDDFIKKPFSLEVLLAKVKAVIRRTYAYSGSEPDIIEYQGVILDLNSYQISYQEKRIELSKNEFRIMALLMKMSGQVVSRAKVMQALWEDESFIDDNTLTVNINRLRKRLTEIGLEGFIHTKRGQGYLIP